MRMKMIIGINASHFGSTHLPVHLAEEVELLMGLDHRTAARRVLSMTKTRGLKVILSYMVADSIMVRESYQEGRRTEKWVLD